MRKYIIDLLKKADPSYILGAMFRYFVAACGFTLLLCFFNKNVAEYARENIVNVVASVISLECALSILFKVALAFARWSDTGSLVEQKTYPEARREDVLERDENVRIVAVHEAGHAIMAYLKNAKMFDINIAQGCVKTEYNFLDLEAYKNGIMVKYAGAVSEELIFGHFCSGSFGSATADFESATEQIKGYIVMTDNSVSKSMLEEEIGSRVISLSKELYAETLEVLTPYKDMIQHLSDILMTKGSMETEEVREVLDAFVKQEHLG